MDAQQGGAGYRSARGSRGDEPLTYSYDYPHPAMTADVALLSAAEGRLALLLVRRAQPPFAGHWALPGGFMNIDETLAHCAARELREETGIVDVSLVPLGVFDQPDRDPRERVITLVHVGIVRLADVALEAGSDAGEVRWFTLDALPDLAFDHGAVVACLRSWLADHPDPLGLALAMISPDGQPSELVTLYADITGQNR
ncbi:MAG: NUDIX hydrolase [Alphaproteobacteria bacterium]|nr:MAG: NUDIX hydrolase [Alphaproteobacteria bacterium]